jgi:hypothetical protein
VVDLTIRRHGRLTEEHLVAGGQLAEIRKNAALKQVATVAELVRRRKRRGIGLCSTLRRKTWTYATHHQSPVYDGCALCSQYILLSIWQCIVYACSCTFESMNWMCCRSYSARALRMSNTWPCSTGLRASLTRSTDAATRPRCSVALRRALSARATRPVRLLCLHRRCAA